jgi:hypothetical protein
MGKIPYLLSHVSSVSSFYFIFKELFPRLSNFFFKKIHFSILYWLRIRLDNIFLFFYEVIACQKVSWHWIDISFGKKKKNKFSTFKKSLKCEDQIFQWDKNTSFFKLFIRLIFLKLFPPKSFLFQFGSQ